VSCVAVTGESVAGWCAAEKHRQRPSGDGRPSEVVFNASSRNLNHEDLADSGARLQLILGRRVDNEMAPQSDIEKGPLQVADRKGRCSCTKNGLRIESSRNQKKKGWNRRKRPRLVRKPPGLAGLEKRMVPSWTDERRQKGNGPSGRFSPPLVEDFALRLEKGPAVDLEKRWPPIHEKNPTQKKQTPNTCQGPSFWSRRGDTGSDDQRFQFV